MEQIEGDQPHLPLLYLELPPTVVQRIRKPDYFINTLRNADRGFLVRRE